MNDIPYIPLDRTTIGSCSLCGGPVTVPNTWSGIHPPAPTCQRCGAVKADSYGPVIPMVRPSPPAAPSGFYGGRYDHPSMTYAAPAPRYYGVYTTDTFEASGETPLEPHDPPRPKGHWPVA